MKRILSAVFAIFMAFSLTACKYFDLKPSPAETVTSAVSEDAVSSEPSSSEAARGAMDNSTAIDLCLRMYNLIHPMAQLKTADELSDGDVTSLEKLVAKAEKYESDTDQRTIYTVAMANAANQALHYGTEGYTDETLAAAVEAANNAYYDMYMGFRQELRIVEKSEWQKAAKILSQR